MEQLRRWSVIRKCFTVLYYLFHPQITIVETGEYKWLGIGITDKAYKKSDMPGWYEESLGYHTDDGNIFHNTKHLEGAIGTKGIKTCQRDKTVFLMILLHATSGVADKVGYVVGRRLYCPPLTFWDNKKLSIPFGLLYFSRFITRLTTYRNKVIYLF